MNEIRFIRSKNQTINTAGYKKNLNQKDIKQKMLDIQRVFTQKKPR